VNALAFRLLSCEIQSIQTESNRDERVLAEKDWGLAVHAPGVIFALVDI
jgi:hypothetical protein